MGRIIVKLMRKVTVKIKGKAKLAAAAFVLTVSIILISTCENPVQDYVSTNLYGPKFNLEVTKLSETEAIDYGFSVDTYGDYIIVGAPANRDNTTVTESAYIYHRTGVDEWEGPFTLPQPANYVVGDRFGYSVSIYGDFAAVGAPDTTVNGNKIAGAVYIYKKKSGTINEWEEEKRVTKADQTGNTVYPVAENDKFGSSVKLYNNWLLIGAPYDGLNGPGSDYGQVYRFKYNGTNWDYDYFFSRNTVLEDANFGIAIDVNSSYAVIGAPGEDIDSKGNVGSVYIYSFNNNKFEFKERITNTAYYTGDDDYFGGSLSLSGDFLAIGVGGAIVDDIFIAGNVQVYMLKDGIWNNTPAVLKLKKPAEYDFFGFPVAVKQINDNEYILLSGCFDRDNDDLADAGAVFIYTNTAGKNEWTLQKELRASDSSGNSYFGRSIAVGDDYAIVGACTPRFDTVFENGRVYIFR